MAAVLAGRGDGEDIELVVKSLQRCGYLDRLVESQAFQHIARQIVEGARREARFTLDPAALRTHLGQAGAQPVPDGNTSPPALLHLRRRDG